MKLVMWASRILGWLFTAVLLLCLVHSAGGHRLNEAEIAVGLIALLLGFTFTFIARFAKKRINAG
jgi:hypothetical protein